MKQKDLFRNALRQGAGLPTERSSSDILAAGKSRARVRPSLAGYAAVAAASAVIAGSGVLFVMSSRSTAKPELSANDASQALSSSEEIRAERTIDLSALQGLLEDISESPELFDYSASRTRLDIDKGEEEMYYISNESKDEAAAETLRSVACYFSEAELEYLGRGTTEKNIDADRDVYRLFTSAAETLSVYGAAGSDDLRALSYFCEGGEVYLSFSGADGYVGADTVMKYFRVKNAATPPLFEDGLAQLPDWTKSMTYLDISTGQRTVTLTDPEGKVSFDITVEEGSGPPRVTVSPLRLPEDTTMAESLLSLRLEPVSDRPDDTALRRDQPFRSGVITFEDEENGYTADDIAYVRVRLWLNTSRHSGQDYAYELMADICL